MASEGIVCRWIRADKSSDGVIASQAGADGWE